MSKKMKGYLVITSAGIALFLILASLGGPAKVQAQQGQQPPMPVNVTNDILHAVPTLASDNPAFTPFQSGTTLNLTNGVVEQFDTLTTVPAGKRLVIEFVGVEVYNSVGGSPISLVRLQIPNSGNLYEYPVVLVGQGAFTGGLNGPQTVSVAAQPVRLYVDAGQRVFVTAERGGNVGSDRVIVSISGYFVPKPPCPNNFECF